MRVKVGGCWFEPAIGVPIMVEFSAEEAPRVLRDPSRARVGAFVEGDPFARDAAAITLFVNEGARDLATLPWLMVHPRPHLSEGPRRHWIRRWHAFWRPGASR